MTEDTGHYDLKQFDAYIGDGVYASFDGYQIWLAANHPSNKVVALEPSTYDRLQEYVARLSVTLAEKAKKEDAL